MTRTQSQANSESFFAAACREPYRVFFPLGIVMGVVGASHWLFFALGWIKTPSSYFHSSIQMQGYMACFIFGFLLTAMPRFAQTDSATPLEFTRFFALTVGILLGQSFGQLLLAHICFLLLVVNLALFARRRFKTRKTVSPPLDFVWIPIGILHAATGSIVFVLHELHLINPTLLSVAKPMIEQGFLLAVVLGVGGFLGPRLMGIYQLIKSPETLRMEQVPEVRNKLILQQFFLGIVLYATFWMEGHQLQFWAYSIRALIVTVKLWQAGIIRKMPTVPDFYARLLWVSFWMVLVGSWNAALFIPYRIVALHLVFIGGYSLMTFAVATMVIFSHAGEAARLKDPLLVLWVVAIGVFATVGFRIVAVFLPNSYFNILAIASGFWLLAGISWLIVILPKVIAVPHGIDFEAQHEAAKRRVLNAHKK